MKKILLFSFALFYSLFFYSQTKNNEVIYKFMLVRDTVNITDKANQIKKTESEIAKIAQTIKPKLVFNDSIASFYCDDILDKGDKFLYNMAKIYCNCDTPTIYNKKEKKIYYNTTAKPFTDKSYTVYEQLSKDWKLSNETKKIDNYTCYKATAIKKEAKSKGEFISRNVTAWYCPELPFSYGPKGYGGLPGLILELQEDNLFYGMTSIKIKNSDAKLETVKKYELISSVEYFKLIDETIAKYNSKN